MLAKTIFAATFVALAQFAVASPPACLLGAVNEYKNPADIKAVCKAKDITTKVESFCGDLSAEALDALADICNEKNVKLARDNSPSETGSTKPSASGSKPHATGSNSSPTGSSSSHGHGNSTVTATGGPKPTSSSDSDSAAGKLQIGSVALMAGLLAIAL